MKVKDLIKELEKLPQDSEIGYLETTSYDDNNGMNYIYEVRAIEGWYLVTEDIDNFDCCEYYLQ